MRPARYRCHTEEPRIGGDHESELEVVAGVGGHEDAEDDQRDRGDPLRPGHVTIPFSAPARTSTSRNFARLASVQRYSAGWVPRPGSPAGSGRPWSPPGSSQVERHPQGCEAVLCLPGPFQVAGQEFLVDFHHEGRNDVGRRGDAADAAVHEGPRIMTSGRPGPGTLCSGSGGYTPRSGPGPRCCPSLRRYSARRPVVPRGTRKG